MIRKVFFWAHLAVGLVVGIFVLLMSATGVLLTYENQMEGWAVASAVTKPEGAAPLTIDQMVETALAGGAEPGQQLVLSRNPETPASIAAGRESTYLNPYTGEAMDGAGAGTRAFFGSVTSLHRWLSLSGSTQVGGAIMDVSNLLFLFLVVSGLYLWLPPTFHWVRIKAHLLLRLNLPSAQARHYNWHHVFGIWALVPLFVIVLSGVIISYPWASRLMYAAVGEEAPARGGRGGGGGGQAAQPEGPVLQGDALAVSALIEAAAVEAPRWRTARVTLPAENAAQLQLVLDEGNGQQAGARTNFVLDRATGTIVSQQSALAATKGARLRSWMRFAHTGQIYGIVGQTIAGLASLAGVLLVYTGISLGIRRLVRMQGQAAKARRSREAEPVAPAGE
jgi:uncharacterized iron-regulated membrane protein